MMFVMLRYPRTILVAAAPPATPLWVTSPGNADLDFTGPCPLVASYWETALQSKEERTAMVEAACF
jgi:hypothetical protein